MATIYIETHGCQMNEADSQYIVRRATSAGYTLAERAEDASVLVLNTCTVRDNAEKKAYGRLSHWKAIKDADPSVRVIVAGCLAEQDRDRMATSVEHLDGVFGTRDLRALGDQLEAWRPEFADDGATVERELDTVIGGTSDGVTGPYDALRAFVNVQRGCSYFCTFCIVPHVRGRFDHRPLADILAEVQRKVAAGAREIMLVGQTVNAYKEPATGADFADLLEIIAAIDGVERIAFVSSHPKDLNEKLARVCATLPKMNPRFHLAVQSGSNPMLRRMNRKYTIEEFRERVGTFLRHNPAWAITTDVIVGFPGETEADFQGDARSVRHGDVRAGVHVRLFAAPRNARGALGTGRSRRRARALHTARRGHRCARARLSRSQDRHDGTRAHPRRLAQRSDAACRQDHRQRHRAFPDGRRPPESCRTVDRRGGRSRGRMGCVGHRRRPRAGVGCAGASDRRARHRSASVALSRP